MRASAEVECEQLAGNRGAAVRVREARRPPKASSMVVSCDANALYKSVYVTDGVRVGMLSAAGDSSVGPESSAARSKL